MTKISVQEVSKLSARGFSKLDARYWQGRLFRNSFTKGGARVETKDWCVKIAHVGRRETINLKTSNAAAAASKAATLYKKLIAEGWDAALATFKPKAVTLPGEVTIGLFIEAVTAASGARQATVWEYAKSLRRIAADINGIDRGAAAKFDYVGGGAEKWRAQVDALPLATLTTSSLQSWKMSQTRTIDDPAALRTAKTTTNSVMRKAKSMWSKKVLPHLPASMILPPCPFTDIKFFEKASTRYRSTIDVPGLLEAATVELQNDPARLETWKAFLLLMFAGLRRGEVDKLPWVNVDLAKGDVHIEDTAHFAAKSESSKGVIQLDPELVTMMREWREKRPNDVFVLRSPLKVQTNKRHHRYRAKPVFDDLKDWLRSHGVTARKALHELRKESGSLVAAKHGLYAASKFLRHADIRVTAAHYLDAKERVTVGLGGMLTKDQDSTKEGA